VVPLKIRLFGAAVIFLFAAVPPLWAQPGKLAAGTSDRAQVLDGVRELAAPGAPGSLAVFAKSATALMTGTSDGRSPVAVVACGYLGSGRVVAFAHDGYFGLEALKVADTGILLVNALHWAAAQKRSPRVGLIDGHALQSLFEIQGASVARTTLGDNLRTYDVLVVTPYRLTPQEVPKLRSFVESGGGLLAAATGWGWQQGSRKPMSAFSGNLVLNGSGIGWTDGFAKPTTTGRFSLNNEISPFVNAATALELIASHSAARQKDFATALESVRLALAAIPAAEVAFRAKTNSILKDLRRLDLVPSREKPVRADDPLRRFAVGLETVIAQDAPVAGVKALTASRSFPGAVSAGPAKSEHTVIINTAVPGWHSLGLYAAPGDRVTVSAPRTVLALDLTIQIGSHTDQLWHLDSWERMPQIVRRFPVTEAHTNSANGLGGLIYIDVPEGAPSRKFPVSINNAVEAPFYRLGVTTNDEWQRKLRHRPGPWAELEGKKIIFTVPSSAVRNLEDPKAVLTLWDEIVTAQDSFVSLKHRDKPERIVADIQISAGYMHSGYPIMVPIDDSIKVAFSPMRIRREGAWGIFHELGHNHQRPDWTFDGTGEVTNNLIVLFIFDKVLGLPFDSGHEAIRDRNARNQRIRAFWAKGSPFHEWKSDPFLALMMYIQLYEAFGSKPFADVFAEYARLPGGEQPKSDDEKRDQWLLRMSKATGKNLGPFFRAWGVPTSDAAQASVASLTPWMPRGFSSRQ
jgi:hypothetical protein